MNLWINQIDLEEDVPFLQNMWFKICVCVCVFVCLYSKLAEKVPLFKELVKYQYVHLQITSASCHHQFIFQMVIICMLAWRKNLAFPYDASSIKTYWNIVWNHNMIHCLSLCKLQFCGNFVISSREIKICCRGCSNFNSDPNNPD